MTSEEDTLRALLRSFRAKEVEPTWELLDRPEGTRFEDLWRTLSELGCTRLGLAEAHGGITLSPEGQLAVMRELGAGIPALGAALLGHITAQRWLSAALGNAAYPAQLEDARLAFCGNPLDATPLFEAPFVIWTDERGVQRIHGDQRLLWPQPEQLCVPALDEGVLRLVVLPAETAGVQFVATASSHGLCLLPFGTLSLRAVPLSQAHVYSWPWPFAAAAATREADALLAGLLAGCARELADRAGAYALERYQGGRKIHEHDAVRQLIGPIELARRVIDAFALATLTGTAPGDGAASAFAVELARQAGLDAIQTLGGYGYMEDYRVERYLRDANTLETLWIHADARRRAIAAAHCARLAS
jgi:alkylation response protein AidB-like acyl-CoA dehydrogenase